MTDILVITGLSGAGRSQAADDLEDLGWFVVDNLPSSLIEKVAELGSMPGTPIARLALVVGLGSHQADIVEVIHALRRTGHRVSILFLDCADAELVRRYTMTRRRHPLAEGHDGSVPAGIAAERARLEPVKELADIVIDTTELNVHQLKARLVDAFGGESAPGMQTTVASFGYKHGLPLDADIVLDVRFLPNPHWVESLRPLTGLDEDVRAYVMGQDAAVPFLDRVDELLASLVPAYVAEGKSYLTVAVGCTGGRHRSVAISEELGHRLRRRGVAVKVQHRDLDRKS
ncbi:MAG TPA: RNase adapter RapZ [Acidimicrobiales bacterium]